MRCPAIARRPAARIFLGGLTAILAVGVAAAQPRPPDPAVAVPLHLRRAGDRLARVVARDEIGRRALDEARVSFDAAQSAARDGRLVMADQLAASADDLVRAADDRPPPRPPGGPPPPPPQAMSDAPRVLANVDVIVAALATVAQTRVRSLVAFAVRVASAARHDAALDEPNAGREAARAEAIARAAAHVAIAADPTLQPMPAPPRPPRLDGGPPPPPARDRRA